MESVTTRSRSRQRLLLALGIQAASALVVLATNAYLLNRFGGAVYQKLATLLSVFIAANYFDFGYLGQVRITAASSVLSADDKRQISRRLFWNFTGRALVFEAALVTGTLLLGARSGFLAEMALTLAIAPLVVHVNAFRAYLEGSGALVGSSLVRAGFGIFVGLSPLLALAIFDDPVAFSPIIGIASLAFTSVFYVKAIGWLRSSAQAGLPAPQLPRGATIAWLETIYVLSGAVFLYGDRYALMALENSARAGTYLFVLELVSRVSLLYVPLVMQVFPQLTTRSEQDPPAAFQLLRATDRKVLVVVAGAFTIALLAAAAVNGHVQTNIYGSYALALALPLSLAYTFNASSYLHQRFTTVVLRHPHVLLYGYLALVGLAGLAFWLLYRQWGVPGVAVAFLLRTLAENIFLRWLLRSARPSLERPT